MLIRYVGPEPVRTLPLLGLSVAPGDVFDVSDDVGAALALQPAYEAVEDASGAADGGQAAPEGPQAPETDPDDDQEE